MCGIPDSLDAGKMVARLAKPPGVPGLDTTPPPPPPPDMTDDLVQKARASMVRRQLMGQGMASTFLSGPLGDLTSAPTLKQSAGGM
jgi:hypothetical protein